mmetsp:Transcript_13476/g.36312  ORF Transcript_13476/g.36312 Transcript_13476/m.36312 type:complete len:161 (-) Transcript_13476:146-628(-)
MAETSDALDRLFPQYRRRDKFVIDSTEGTGGMEGFIIARDRKVTHGISERIDYNVEILFPAAEYENDPVVVDHLVLRIWGDRVLSQENSHSLSLACTMAAYPTNRHIMLVCIPSGDSRVDREDLEDIAKYAREKLKFPGAEAGGVIKILEAMMAQFSVVS